MILDSLLLNGLTYKVSINQYWCFHFIDEETEAGGDKWFVQVS